tara:strand:- start:1094 stop:3115 length:2022 start_codon:yes stop_codon:yes gene_type:complete
MLILLLLPAAFFGQQLADKNIYLVDSIVLADLSDDDRLLLDSCLNSFSLAKDDTSKIAALNFICDNLVNDIWSDYQFVQYELIEMALNKNISLSEKITLEIYKAGSLNNLGLYYEYQEGNTSKALEFYLKALKLFEKLEDKNGEAMLLNRIGSVYTEQDDKEKGLEYYKKSLVIYHDLNEGKEISNPLNNLGLYYQEVGDYPQALEYFKKSLKIDEINQNMQGIAISLSNIGRVYMAQKKYKKALIPFINGLNVFEKIQDKNGIALVSSNIGQVYFVEGDYSTAFVNAKRSFDIGKEIGALNRMGASALLLSDIYEKQNKPKEALEMYKISIQTRDSLLNESTRSDAIKQQSKYEYDKQKAVDDAFYDKQQHKQKVIIYAVGFSLTLVVAFLIFVFSRLQITRKQKLIIEGTHKELSEKNGEILDSITYAKRIQNAILPTDSFVKEHLKESFVLYKPKDIVAGDFYWMKTVGESDETILFAAADCTGHGVPGAMVSMVCNNALNRSIKEYDLTDPGNILDKTQEIVTEEFSAGFGDTGDYVRDGMDIALCAITKSQLKYAGANNSLWLLRNEELIIIKANKQPIGRFRSTEPFTTHSFDLQRNDTIYIFSDGYVDQFGGEKGKKFMVKAFKDLILSIQSQTMEQQKESLLAAFRDWKGDIEQVDDVCVIGVRV